MNTFQKFFMYGALSLTTFVSSPLHAQHSDPFAGVFTNENSFDGYINQNTTPTGSILLRTSKPRAGLGLLQREFEGKYSGDSSTKYKVEGPVYFFYGVYPFSNGLHVGFTHENTDYKFKSDGIGAKMKNEMNAISFAGKFKNGFGFGLIFEQNREEVDSELSSSNENDVSWGIIRPELYYSTQNFDVIVKVSPTMRHKTGNKAGFIQADGEYKLDSSMNLIVQAIHKRSSEVDDDENNHIAVAGGARYTYDANQSNISGKLILEEAYNKGPANAAPGNIAEKGLLFMDEHGVAPGHRLGGTLYYSLSDGKGSDFRGNSRNITATDMAYGLSYTCVF